VSMLNLHRDPDPFRRQFGLSFTELFHPYGYPVEIATNAEEVLAATHESWGAFQKMFAEKPLQLRIAVVDGDGEAELKVPVIRAQRHLFAKVGGLDDFVVCDTRQGFGFCWLAAGTARNWPHLRTYYVEAMVFAMLHALYMTPIHAGCVALNGHGMLLCGDSQAGKSTLSYACARKGWTFIADDLSELVRGQESNVVFGNPHRVRLRESAVELFPELRGRPVALSADGDRSIELATAAEAGLVTAPYSAVEYLVFLDRQITGRPALTPFSKEKALRWLQLVLSMNEPEVREEQAVALRRLLEAEIVRFRYSDIDAAANELKTLVGTAGDARPAIDLLVGSQDHV
jgi:hypothetical protein